MKKIAKGAVLLAGLTGPAWADGFGMLNVGIDYLNQQRYADAVTWLDKAIAAGDLNSDQMHVAYLDRGEAHAQLNHADAAAADFTAALALRPDDPEAQLQRSLAYVAAGQAEKAAADIAATNIATSKIPWVILYRGLVAWELGRYPAASEAFAELSDRGYTDGWLWLQLANIKQGKALTKYAGVKRADGTILISGIPYWWPGPLMSFYAGSKTEADVTQGMDGDFASKDAECRGNLFLGEWHLAHGDAGGAKILLDKARNACPAGDIEWQVAGFETKKL